MAQDRPKELRIKLEQKTGRIIEVLDENNNKAEPVDPKEIEKIHLSKDGFRYIGSLLHAHSSPG